MVGNRPKILRVLDGERFEVPPIWLMRQAGRYLPEYREVRSKVKNFLDLCYDPDLATEVTLQPIRRFGLDGAILFSDILVIPDAMGQSVSFETGKGPVMEPLRCASDIERLGEEGVMQHLAPVIETVRRVRRELPEDVALLGFCGAPWTVATYMIAGRGTSDQAPARLMSYREENLFGKLIDKIVRASGEYLLAQLEAGADAVQIFDTWAGVLTEEQFRRWVIEPTKRIVKHVRKAKPDARIIGFPKGSMFYAKEFISETGVDGIGIDWTTPRRWARDHLQEYVAIQGNIDPLLMIVGGKELDRSIDDLVHTLGGGRLIVNLGHGITPDAEIRNVERLIERVRTSDIQRI